MNENRFVAPIVYEIAYNIKDEDLFWDFNRRDLMYYMLIISEIKILLCWIFSPLIILLSPLLLYFVFSVYMNLFWLVTFAHYFPSLKLDVPYTLDIYRFYDWSSMLILQADDLCPGNLRSMADGHCGCQDDQVLRGKLCVDVCPRFKSLNRYDTAIFDILPACLNIYEFYDWYAQTNPLLENRYRLGGSLNEHL